MENKKTVQNYYDNYTERQLKVGINQRHRSIINYLKKSGLKKDYTVLEIGCGIGTLSGLLVKYLKKGKLLAIDLSPKSIEIAKSRLRKYKNVSFHVQDVNEWTSKERYDFIVLPDVLEHIPFEAHDNVFKQISLLLNENGKAFINMPAPHFQKWLKSYYPDKMQLIDLVVSAKHVLDLAEKNQLYVKTYDNYSIWHSVFEYQYFVLVKESLSRRIQPFEPNQSFFNKVKEKMQLLWVKIKT